LPSARRQATVNIQPVGKPAAGRRAEVAFWASWRARDDMGRGLEVLRADEGCCVLLLLEREKEPVRDRLVVGGLLLPVLCVVLCVVLWLCVVFDTPVLPTMLGGGGLHVALLLAESDSSTLEMS
jgi:hypothetical protein